MPDALSTDLERLVGRLVDRLAAATPAWYAARPHRHEGSAETRAEVLRGLVADLARLGYYAGTGVPAGLAPPVLGDHALAYQLAVLAHELVIAPIDLTAEAAAAVRTARAELDAPLP